MALTAVEEAQLRDLIAQQSALLSLATSEATIISKLGATKKNLSEVSAATGLTDTDLLFVRQGTTDKSITGALVKAATMTTVVDASETVKGIVELATLAEAQAGIDIVRAVTPAGLASVGKQMQSIDYTLATNTLTLKLNPTTLPFRSTILTNGQPTLVSNAVQIATTISSGSTGGTISGIASEIYILAINSAGTIELAWCNAAGGINLDETTLINTTAEGGVGAADLATVIYSTTARTGVAFRVVGSIRSTQTTAGTWAQTPSLVQPMGGNALAAMSSLGYGQTWQVVTGSRASATTYYNTTGKPIMVYAGTLSGSLTTVIVGGVTRSCVNALDITFIVPPGMSYSITLTTVSIWTELR